MKKLINILKGWKFFYYNPHSTPGLCNLICKLGRHDLSVVYMNKQTNQVLLECFYCQKRKLVSWTSE